MLVLMPYLQLDVNGTHAKAAKQRLARRICESYARMMRVDIRRVSVAIRECGDAAVWRIRDGLGSDPVPVSVLMLDIRRGRSPSNAWNLPSTSLIYALPNWV
jgi:phenylpyruvate tautomerase PptA (4-oxalocrotonate tautomerase family)